MNKEQFVARQSSSPSTIEESHGAALVRSALVWDECISWTSMDLVGADKSIKQQALPQYRDAGVNVASLTIGGDYGTEFQRSRGWVASERRFINERLSDVCLLIRDIGDIERARQQKKLAVTFHLQGATPFLNYESEEPGNLDLVSFYYDLGVRRALLAHNHRNALADGCKEPDNAGLSLFGRRIVREMGRVGMVLDCTHMGERSSLEAMEVTGKPSVFSHSNAAAVFLHPRNISDQLIKACAATGGVIGLTGWGPIVNERNDPSPEAIAKHVYYVSDLVGPQHVGLGLDYVYVPELTTKRVKENAQLYAPLGSLEQYNYHHEVMRFAPPTTFSPLADRLLEKMSEQEVRGILGENWLRVAAANWR